MRTLMVVYEHILGASSTEYTDELHDWYMQGLSKKRGPKTVQDTATLADMDALSMQKTVKEMQTALATEFTVTWSTAFVLRCETRQVFNACGLGGVERMTQAVQRSRTLQAVVEKYRQALLQADTPGKCHTVQIFDAIAKFKDGSCRNFASALAR